VVILYYVVLLLTALERLVEMLVSERNAKWSLARGGREYGRSHFPAMVVVHTLFLAGCALEPWWTGRDSLPASAAPALMVAVACQALRWWCIATLGHQWNTRVIVVPGMPRVTGGPYRWLDHPNYVAVAVEGVALPAIGGAWITAALFTIANLVLMSTRLHAEERALATLVSGGQHDLPATA
jgi:methyltransferase